MSNILILEHRNLRVLTTKQLANFFGTTVKIISQNFQRNEDRFKKGVHYFRLEGDELRAFRSNRHFDDYYSGSIPQNEEYSPNMPNLYLWTERGAARHAKMLNSEKAWEVFERLEETYFSLPETQSSLPEAEPYSPDVQAKINAIADDFTAKIILPVYDEMRRMQKQMRTMQQELLTMRRMMSEKQTGQPFSRLNEVLVPDTERHITLQQFFEEQGWDWTAKRAGNVARVMANECRRRGIPLHKNVETGRYLYPESFLLASRELLLSRMSGGTYAA